jgi:hypothetical protein
MFQVTTGPEVGGIQFAESAIRNDGTDKTRTKSRKITNDDKNFINYLPKIVSYKHGKSAVSYLLSVYLNYIQQNRQFQINAENY